MRNENPDVLIVGAGAGGPVVAKALAEHGASVLMLEAGPWLDPGRDFTRLEDDMGSIIDGRLRWGPSDRSKPPWMRRRVGVGLILQAAGVGGTTLHYNAISVRPYRRSVDGVWPLTYDELVPYFEQVEAYLPVRQLDEGDLATKDAVFGEACEKMGLAHTSSKDITEPVWRRSFNAILPIARMTPDGPLEYPEIDGCTMCGHCLVGCPNPAGAPLERKAKRATNVNYVPDALATGSCEVVPNAFATLLLFDDDAPGGRGGPRPRRPVARRRERRGPRGEREGGRPGRRFDRIAPSVPQLGSPRPARHRRALPDHTRPGPGHGVLRPRPPAGRRPGHHGPG